jgi:hypothetical protein
MTMWHYFTFFHIPPEWLLIVRHCLYAEKKLPTFGLIRHLKFFSAYFYAGCLEAEMRQKNFGPKKLWTFFHETITVFSEPWPP